MRGPAIATSPSIRRTDLLRTIVKLGLSVMVGLTCLTAYADTRTCLRLSMRLAEESSQDVKNYWDRQAPLTVDTRLGPQPIAFGFDAELWHVADVLRLLRKSPKTWREAVKVMERTPNLQFTRAKMRRMLGLRDEAALREASKPGRIRREKLSFADIKPAFLERISHGPDEKSAVAYVLTDLVTEALERRNIPVEAEEEGCSGSSCQGRLGEGSAVELVMKGSIESPAEFNDLIRNFLYKDTEYPETHFHVSIPSAGIKKKHLLLAARALETKIILEELMADLKGTDTLSPYDASAIATRLGGDVGRGVVRTFQDRWKEPVPAHDVEIRQWLSVDHAMGNLQFFIKLAQNGNRLRDLSRRTGKSVPNIAPANLNASLQYAATLLRDRLPAELADVPDQLESYSKEIVRQGKLSPEKRGEIREYFRSKNLLKYLTIETFLE